MKKVLALVLASLLTISLVGCNDSKTNTPADGSSGSTNETETVTISYYGEGDAPKIEARAKAIPLFEEATGIKVDVQAYNITELFEIIEVQIAAGEANVDVIDVDSPLVHAYHSRGYLIPLEEYFTEEEKKQFTEKALEAASVDGTLVAPPIDNSSQILYYNKDLLDLAGLEYPSADPADRITWEEVVDMAQKVMDAAEADGQEGVWGLTFEQISRPYQMLCLPLSLGGDDIGEDTSTVDGIWNTEPWYQAAQWYYDIHNTWNIAPRGDDQFTIRDLFASGKLAFMLAGNWMPGNLALADVTCNWGYAAHPYFEGGKAVTATGCWNIGVASTSKNPEAAAEFVKFMTIGEGNDFWHEDVKSLSARTAVLEEEAESPEFQEFPDSIQLLAADESVNTSVIRPLMVGYSEYQDVFSACWEDIRNGGDPVETIDTYTAELNSLLAKYAE